MNIAEYCERIVDDISSEAKRTPFLAVSGVTLHADGHGEVIGAVIELRPVADLSEIMRSLAPSHIERIIKFAERCLL